MKLTGFLILIIGISLTLVSAASANVSIWHGSNGSNDVPLLVNTEGKLLTNLNYSMAVAISPEANNSYNLGSSSAQWLNIYAGSVRSAGDLSIHAGGSEKMAVNASGNVGIGFGAPQHALHVNGQTNVTGTLILNGTTNVRGVLFNWPSADGTNGQVLTTNGTGGLSWATAGGGSSNISARNVSAGSFGAEVGAGNYSFPANLSVSVNLSIGGRLTDKTGFVTPVGMVMIYVGAVPPAGWLMANGSEINRTTYPELFNITGTIYGNTSDSTFKLPDLRQRFALGKADSGTGSTLGGTGGSIDHTHTGPSHTHAFSTMIAHTHAVDPPSTASDSTGSHSHSFDPASTASGGGSSHTHSVDPASTSGGSSGDHSHTYVAQSNMGTSCCDSRAVIGGGTGADNTEGGGSHTHTFDVASFTSAAETTHTHSTDIASTTSSSNGGHTHSTDIASFTSGSTGSASGTSDAGGTGATGTGNPPFLVMNFIIKY